MSRITRDQAERFNRDGFAVIDRAFAPAALDEVRLLLDPLFERFQGLSRRHAVDLSGEEAAIPRIPDINRALRLEPRLRRTRIFRECRRIARDLLGPFTWCTFDHAVFKPSRNTAATPWHQDQAFASFPRPLQSVHCWIPLQDATRENGCMWFIPGSHTRHTKHHPAGSTLSAVEVDEATAVCCPVAAGGLTLHRPLTLHYTGPNRTDSLRRVWVLHFARWGQLGRLHPQNVRSTIGSVLAGSTKA